MRFLQGVQLDCDLFRTFNLQHGGRLVANEADIRMCKVIDERHLIQMVKTTQFLKELDVNRCRCRVV